MQYFIGVDVGTASVRAGLVQLDDGLVSVTHTAVRPIRIWNDSPDHYEQATDDIWSALVSCVRAVLAESEVSGSQVKGVGFDATCSLVALDKQSQPLSVSLSNDNHRNVIMWMDHRAEREADEINSTDHRLLRFVGGRVSLEMEMPKVLWLKKNLTGSWGRLGHLFDLPDFLTYKATGSYSRSLCSLVCKWLYDASEGDPERHGWDDELLQTIGLAELKGEGHQVLGSQLLLPGQPCGSGLTREAAAELGLSPHTPVGTSLIDAHAGGVGMLLCKPSSIPQELPVNHKLGLICGTSTCHMIVGRDAMFVPGVWGPYYSAMVPGMWLNEGGQSATGKLLDYVIESHPAFPELRELAQESQTNHYAVLAARAAAIASERCLAVHALTRDLHVTPDFHGNRSPLADPSMRGAVCGLSLNNDLDDLTLLYMATLQSLVFGTRQTVEAMANCGHKVKVVYMCGGLTKNKLFVQMTADVLSRPVVVAVETESVLLGSAMLGVCASRLGSSLADVIEDTRCDGLVYHPDQSASSYYEKKYQVFVRMINDQLTYRKIMMS